MLPCSNLAIQGTFLLILGPRQPSENSLENKDSKFCHLVPLNLLVTGLFRIGLLSFFGLFGALKNENKCPENFPSFWFSLFLTTEVETSATSTLLLELCSYVTTSQFLGS